MTRKSKQIRAVALAALMVLSVFAGTIAFTGTAAAAANSVTVESGSEVVSSGSDVAFTVTNNTSTTGDIQYWIDLNNDGFYNDSEPSGSTAADSSGEYTGQTLTVPSGASEGSYQVAAYQNASLSVGDEAEATASFEVDNSKPTLKSAIHYDNDTASGSDNVDAELELAFNKNVDASSATVTLLNSDEEEITTLSNADTAASEGGRVVFDLSKVYTDDISITYSVDDTAGNTVSVSDTDDAKSVTFASTTIRSNDANAYKGSKVAVVSNSTDSSVEIEGEDNYAFSGSTGDHSKVFVFNTENRALGEYNVTFDSATRTIDLRDLGLSLDVDDQNITTSDTVSGTVSANAGNRPVSLQLYESDGDEFGAEVNDSLNGQGEYEFDIDAFSDTDNGEYTLEVRDDYSGVTVESSTIKVAKASDGSASFSNSIITEQRGDTVEIPVTVSNNDYATVNIGSTDVGFLANVTVEDENNDGKVVIRFNTWEAIGASGSTTGSSDVFTVKNDDDAIVKSDIQSENSVESLLDAGEYDLEVRANQDASSSSQNVGTLVLEERSTESLQTWTASDRTDLSDLSALNEAAENGNLTQDSKIADGDYVVTQIVASGIGGIVDGANDNASALLNNSKFSLTFNQSEAPTNREAYSLNVSEDNVQSVVADTENDTYYVVFDSDAGDIGAFRPSGEVDFGDGDSLTANFTVAKDKGNLSSEETSTTANFDLIEGEHSLDDPYNVANAAGQTIEGTSNVAPGTELQLRVRSDSDVRPSFLKTATVHVTENNTFSADFDFSGQNVNDTFTVKVSGSNAASDETVDGEVVEGSQVTETVTDNGTATTDEPVDTTTDAPATTTAVTTTSTGETATEGPTETDTSTPGFGVVVAVTALLAAALLAVRRD
ncbi:DUF7827 domain-containing protein [Halopelagius longus]|uniref:PGF-CTERM protein/surface glycoprotein n=1 Tax=Halopelagius longus TaxID=1236180 RepID=A0A1H1C4A2_9EURY|nr:BGTF surface domain-containing protein [Halopelagius longus]RDI71061.1 PGF-CTERM sorting domain-containing protein [Halopelagius longus]SDQ59002.1 PGF-CTERM protein/surface glycoprotein [Halopelagius longus]